MNQVCNHCINLFYLSTKQTNAGQFFLREHGLSRENGIVFFAKFWHNFLYVYSAAGKQADISVYIDFLDISEFST